MLCVKAAGAKPKFPAKNEAGDHAAGARLVCIQFTMHGVNACKHGKECTYAHLDGEGTNKDAIGFASLRKFLDHEAIKEKIIFTTEGKRVAGIE